MKNTIYTSSATINFRSIEFNQNGIKINNNIPVYENNWAFLDMQNLYKGVCEKGWKINWKQFRQYLKNCHNVTKAVVFIGYLKENIYLYNTLINAGFTLEFRKVTQLPDGRIDGGNVDADLASFVMDYKNDYYKAIVIADDGDYSKTVESLIKQNKLKQLISSHSIEKTSYLLKEIALELIISIDSLKPFIEYK